MSFSSAEVLDCLIVGGGPAGLTAAIYLARFRRSALLMDDNHSRAALIPSSHNYPGFQGIGGPDLLRRLRDQALLYGAALQVGRVERLDLDPDGHFIADQAGKSIRARRILIATGIVDDTPQIDGFRAMVYRGAIRFCPICDAYEAMDRRIGILGAFEAAAKKALFLRSYSRDIFLFATDGLAPRSGHLQTSLREAGVEVFNDAVTCVDLVADKVRVRMREGADVQVDVLYPALGCTVRSELATTLGAACDSSGNLLVDIHQRTSVRGLYAAGDVVTDLHQISVATGHAAIAATDIHNSLGANFR